MLIWTDAQLSPELAPWLRHAFGVQAFPLQELGLRDAEDAEVFAAARAVGAVVLTSDGDFADLLARHGAPPQVLWLTCGDTSSAALRAVLAAAWPRAAAMLVAGEPLIEIGGRRDRG